MGNRLLYALLYVWVKACARLPMAVLYVFSDVLSFFIYRVVRYRLKVVRRNLRHAFPNKTERERQELERRFYRHFADYIVETIKLAGISHEELLRRSHLLNPESVRPLRAQGHTSLILMMGHYGNWEWFTGFPSCFDGGLKVYQIYRPLNNKAFDKLFIFLRTRFGAIGLRKKDVIREIVRLTREKQPSLFVFIADQTPSRANLHYWTTFLNQESAMLTGPERLAVKLNAPVIYADGRKEKRGHYTVDFQLITDRPREMPENRITEDYTRRMEQTILRDPANWLWTHKRWKYKRVKNGE